MSLSIKDGGAWKEPTKVEIKSGGVWKEVLIGSIKDGGAWKEFYRSTYNLVISSNTNRIYLTSLLTAAQKLGDVVVTINPGVYVYSEITNAPAFITGNDIAGTLTIINNGYIYGAGGAGGTGGNPSSGNGGNGGDGGVGLFIQKNILLTNNGSILGGGGGGGGGAGGNDDQYGSDHDFAGGGGGGGGQSMGAGGARNSTCSGSGCNLWAVQIMTTMEVLVQALQQEQQ